MNTREDKEIRELAYRAHSNTSFSPEKRARQQVQDYFLALDQFAEWLEKNAVDGIDKAAELVRFTENYRKALLAYLHAHSRCISSMVTGPANFPVRRAEKANASTDNRMQELIDTPARAQKSIIKRINKLVVENAGGELAMARDLLAKREKQQADMKATNKIIRSKPKYVETPEKIEKLIAIFGGGETLAKKIFEPDCMGCIGFASYSLTNLNARIKSTRQRVQELERRETATTTETETEIGIKVVENAEQDRLQLIFDGKPSGVIRSLLKRNGFRWSPINTAWQRQLTDNARYALKHLMPQIEAAAVA